MNLWTSGRLPVLAAAFLFSTGGAAIKYCQLGSWQVAGFRSGIAAITLLLLVPQARRGWGWATWAVGAAYAATVILFVAANKLTTSASAIFLQSTAPVYILLLGPWLLKEKLRSLDLATTAILAVGAAIMLQGADAAAATAPDPHRGNFLAILSGFFYACTVVGIRWRSKAAASGGGSSIAGVAAGNLLAFLVCLPAALPVEEWRLGDGLSLAFLGVFQMALAYVCLTRGLGKVPALEASLLLLLEPVLNPLWAWLVHGESPGAWSLAGGGVILSGTILQSVLGRGSVTRKERSPSSAPT